MRDAVRDAREIGVRAAARKHGVDRKTFRAWCTDAALRLAQPSADELALLERGDLTAKDLPAITRLRSRGIDYALSREIDSADLPRTDSRRLSS